MKDTIYKTRKNNNGFSLAEVLAALTIGAMILVSVLGIYSRAERSAAAVTLKLEEVSMATEVLQLIAEDLDRIASAGPDTRIRLNNKYEEGFTTSQLIISKSIYDRKNKTQLFEEVTWQTSYDFDSETDGLVLYRSHRGMTIEDKLLDETKDDWERELFIPICPGVTFFTIQAVRGETLLDRWTDDTTPAGIMVTISFAEPYKTTDETFDVEETEKTSRTIAVDRTRKIKFAFEKKEYDLGETGDQNSPTNDPNSNEENNEEGNPKLFD